eukprot:10274942-Lingulodinium_polyedra.AAC.1
MGRSAPRIGGPLNLRCRVVGFPRQARAPQGFLGVIFNLCQMRSTIYVVRWSWPEMRSAKQGATGRD